MLFFCWIFIYFFVREAKLLFLMQICKQIIILLLLLLLFVIVNLWKLFLCVIFSRKQQNFPIFFRVKHFHVFLFLFPCFFLFVTIFLLCIFWGVISTFFFLLLLCNVYYWEENQGTNEPEENDCFLLCFLVVGCCDKTWIHEIFFAICGFVPFSFSSSFSDAVY